MKQSQLLLGVFLVLASELAFALLSALVRMLSDEVSQVQIIFFRNLFALLPLMPWLLKNGVSGLKTNHINLHLLRGLAGLSAMFIYFHVIATTSLVNAAMVLMLAPFFIPIIAHTWLKQAQNLASILSVALGFIGAFVCLNAKSTGPQGELELFTGILILAGALLIGLSKSSISKMSSSEPSQRIVCYFALLGVLISGVMLPFSWQPISLGNFALLVLLGCCATAAQLMMTKAFSFAGATTIGMFSYSSILFAALLGFVWWQETPGWTWYIGAALIVIAGFIAIFHAQRLKRSVIVADK